MTTTLISSNTFNISLAASASTSGPFVDTSGNTAVRIWANSDQNLSIKIIYADASSGSGSVEEQYSVYASHVTAINSTKKKTWAKTYVENTAASTASTVVVKTKHSVRDPQPVLTYMTDDITAQASFNLDQFSVSIGYVSGNVSADLYVANTPVSLNNPVPVQVAHSGSYVGTTNPLPVQNYASDMSLGYQLMGGNLLENNWKVLTTGSRYLHSINMTNIDPSTAHLALLNDTATPTEGAGGALTTSTKLMVFSVGGSNHRDIVWSTPIPVTGVAVLGNYNISFDNCSNYLRADSFIVNVTHSTR